jgi:hypothetical protein
MLPLAGSPIPDSSEALADALRRGFAARDVVAREVTAQGPWPALDLLQIDLTGAKITRDQRLDASAGTKAGGFTVKRFELVAAPGEFEATPITAAIHADDATFEIACADEANSLLQLRRAAHGEVTVEVARADLERLLLALAAQAAGEHGVEIKAVQLSFSSRGPRAISVKADVTAKMFIATATVALSGDLEVDDQLIARLSSLRFIGEGMVANLAGGFIRPQLAKLEGRAFPLMSFSLGEITLRDVQLDAGETLRLAAKFAS